MSVETRSELGERIAAVLAIEPHAPALEFEGRWHSWGELGALADRIAAAIGDDADAPVGIVMRNCPHVVAAIIAVLRSGQCIVTLSHMQPAEQLCEDVRTLGLAAVVAGEGDWAVPGLRDAAAYGVSVGAEVSTFGTRPAVEPAPGVAIQMLTSGTTGRPKRIPLSYRSLTTSFGAARHYESGSAGESRLRGGVAIIAQPLLHISGLYMVLLNLVAGRRVALLERFEVEPFVALLKEHRPPNAAMPPAAIQMVIDAGVDRDAFASVKSVTSGAAPVRPELAERFEELYGAPVLVVYGATEFAGGVAGWTLKDHRALHHAKRGSVGRAHPGVELRVVDPESGAELPVGEVGLLEVRSPQLAIDGGDGWVRATDLASLDDDGFLFIRGRADAMINRGGFKVDSGAVAEVLATHPDIADAAVVGMPDERLGEVPVAAVEVRDGKQLDPAAVLAWARERLTAYQVPARLTVFDELPRTPSSKVSHHQLREALAEREDTP